MRARAEDMAPPPWEVTYIDPAVCGTSIDQWFVMSDPHGVNVGPLSIHEWEPTAHYVASWHPVVALAIADWLEDVAGRSAQNPHWYAADHALAVARAYLGDQS